MLPSCLTIAGFIPKHIGVPVSLTGFGFNLLATWLLSTCFQLILLPGLMVGQNLQNEAADARSSKQFEDVEDVRDSVTKALDLLDLHTEGGLKTLLDAIQSLRATSANPGATAPGGGA